MLWSTHLLAGGSMPQLTAEAPGSQETAAAVHIVHRFDVQLTCILTLGGLAAPPTCENTERT